MRYICSQPQWVNRHESDEEIVSSISGNTKGGTDLKPVFQIEKTEALWQSHLSYQFISINYRCSLGDCYVACCVCDSVKCIYLMDKWIKFYMAKIYQLLQTWSAVIFANNLSTANTICCNVYLPLLGGPRSSKQIHHCQLPRNFEDCSSLRKSFCALKPVSSLTVYSSL